MKLNKIKIGLLAFAAIVVTLIVLNMVGVLHWVSTKEVNKQSTEELSKPAESQ